MSRSLALAESTMKFSICIPNYNYECFIGRTIQSVLRQSHPDLEVLVSDNASSDGSLAVISGLGDSRLRLSVNACNVGFAGNLDRAARMAAGDLMIMLSSDDLMLPETLKTYGDFYDALGADAEDTVTSATMEKIDQDDQLIGRIGPDPQLWTQADRVPELDRLAGGEVYLVKADEMLRRCLRTMKNPFNFAATIYPRGLYQTVEGYGGGRMINPDKWFHWKLLGVAKTACFIDRPLFAYRWHASNQTAQQQATGALKYLVDEYTATLDWTRRYWPGRH